MRKATGRRAAARRTPVAPVSAAAPEWQRRLEDIADAAPGAIVSYLLRPDGSGCFPFASKAIEDIYGFPRDVLARDSSVLDAIIAPGETQRIRASIAESARTLRRWHVEFRICHPARGERWIQASASPERLPDGSTLWHGFLMDVTDKQRAADALRESERKLASIAASLQGFAYRCANTPDWPLEYASDGIAEILGVPAEEFINRRRSFGDMIAPEDREGVWDGVQRAISARQPYVLEYRVHDVHGSERWVWERGAAVFDGQSVVALEGFITDVTDRRRAELALHEADAKMRLAARSGNVGLWDWDLVSNKVYYSPEWKSQLGYAEHEIGDSLAEWERRVHPDDLARCLDTVRAYLATPWPDYRLEFRLRHRKGSYRCILAQATLYRAADGTPVRMLGSHIDVTERRAAEEERRRTEEHFRLLFEHATDGVVFASQAGRPLDVSPSACRLVGYSRDELLHMTATDLVVADDVPSVVDELLRLASGAVIRHEWTFRRKDGSTFLGEVTAKKLPDGRLQAFLRDVTQERAAQEAVRQSEQRLQRALAAGKVGLWELDLRTNAVTLSPEWKRQLGYDDDEIGNDVDEWRRRLHPDDRARAVEALEAYLAGSAPGYESEFRLRHKDGTYRHILTRSSELRDEGGARISLIGSSVDITERVELEAQLRQAQKMESVGRLAGGIAHDFNNLLTVIGGTADLAMLRLPDGDPMRADLQEIRFASERAAALTRQLLAFSRKQILRQDVLNLNAVVGRAQEILRRLIGEDIGLVLKLDADLPSIRADVIQMEQVVLNLAVNARDAMPAGGTLTIETREVALDAAFIAEHPGAQLGPHVLLRISDSGVGMDAPTVARIFEPFFTTKESGKGTGLGLSTVYGIVKQSGGTIFVDSAPRKGTTFRVYFPRADATAVEARAEAKTPERGTETILLVEDEPPLRRLAERFLVSAGYTVLSAADGPQALQLLERHDGPVDLVLTDVVMPGMTGRELVALLGGTRRRMKYLYTSGYTDDEVLRRGVLAEGAHFLGKPYTMTELTRRVREVLDA